MKYVENKQYPLSEYDDIAEWWNSHRQYDINICEDYIEISKQNEERVVENLRKRREYECFSYVNRGQLWYDTLTQEQKEEFMQWYQDWLNVTETLEEPTKPKWLK